MPTARPLTSDDFQAMIPRHFIQGGHAAAITMHPHGHHDANGGYGLGGPSVTVTVKKAHPDMPMLPPAPTDLGKVTETITKSTFTETVMTRITDNHLGEALISEVITIFSIRFDDTLLFVSVFLSLILCPSNPFHPFANVFLYYFVLVVFVHWRVNRNMIYKCIRSEQ